MKKIAAFLAALLVPAAAGAIGFDASSSRDSRPSARSLSWMHTLGGGTDRVVTVAVTVADNRDMDPGASVTFNGVPMTPVPGGLAVSGGHGLLRTELFYLLETSLPPAGSYPVAVQ